MNKTYPVTVQLGADEYRAIRRAGLFLDEKPEMSVRLTGAHFDAIEAIIRAESRPGAPCRRVDAIRLALHQYCAGGASGYSSFTDLVRDALEAYVPNAKRESQ